MVVYTINMIKKYTWKQILYLSLVLCLSVLYIIFLSFDFARTHHSISISIKYSTIIILFIFTFLEFKNWDLRHVLFRFAYLFTLCADLFLLVLNKHYEVGIGFFLCAQIFYFLYLLKGKSKKQIIILLSGYVASLIITNLVLIYALNMFSLRNELAVLYYFLLITNFCSSLLSYKVEGIILPIGFFLFILCDINVGLANLDIPYNSIAFLYFVRIAMWLFYLPSQVLIVSSLDKPYQGEKAHEKEITQ